MSYILQIGSIFTMNSALTWAQMVYFPLTSYVVDFPGSSAGKESTCNAGDLSLIPGSGGSPGEGIGYPFQYSWASLVIQMINNPPEVRET